MRTLKSFLGIVFILILTGCSASSVIVHNIDEKEANTIVVLLASKGIKAQKVEKAASGAGGTGLSMYDITVSEDTSTKSIAILNQNGLPKMQSTTLLSLFGQSGGLMANATQDQIKYQAGLCEQIAGTIRRIDGVLDAQVQIAFPKEENQVTAGPVVAQKLTAAVYVKHQGILDDPNSHLVAKIKRLVAASVAGLDINDVNIIPDRARFLDISLTSSPEMLSGQSASFIEVMNVKIAPDSVATFQSLFFSLLALGILFFLLFLLLAWKCYPIMKAQGFLKLFSIEPFDVEPKHEIEQSKQEPEA